MLRADLSEPVSRKCGVRNLAAALMREASFTREGASKLAHSKQVLQEAFGMNSHDVANALKESGPQTGWQLLQSTRMEALPLWQVCRRAPEIRMECVGKRFVRLDRAVEGYARLSPSIRREFLTYTILGLETRGPEIEARAGKLRQ